MQGPGVTFSPATRRGALLRETSRAFGPTRRRRPVALRAADRRPQSKNQTGRPNNPRRRRFRRNNADPQVGFGGQTDGGRGTGPGVNRPHCPSRLFVVGLLLNPQVGVVGVVGCAGAGDNLLHSGQGVAVAGQEPQVIAAGYAYP